MLKQYFICNGSSWYSKPGLQASHQEDPLHQANHGVDTLKRVNERMSAIMARTFLLQAVVRSSNCSTTKRRKTVASASLPSDRHCGRYLPQLSAPHAPHSKASAQSSLRTCGALSEQNDARELVDSAPIAASSNLTIPESLKAFY
jgi:hypothetical protein